ncbi:MAG: ATP synthase F1 subunit delta, partial [Bacteroidales bacterium]|nr:ATP synthase F1 subunit delta [Bacteroidales bacterium]
SINSRDFMRIMQSPVINVSKKNTIFRAIFAEKLDSLSFAFLEFLTKKKREIILAEIAKEYSELYDESKNIKRAVFQTAVFPDQGLITRVKEILSKQLAANVEIKNEIKPDLVGGFVLKVGDKQYDASVKRNINRLKKEYNVNIYIPKF